MGEPEVCTWKGAPMSSVCATPAVHGDGYNSKIEIPAGHPGLLGAQLPWLGGTNFKKLAFSSKHMVPMIALSRDKCSGEVWGDTEGRVKVNYNMDHHCEEVLMDGVLRAIRVLEAAGVERIMAGQMAEPKKLPPVSDPEGRKTALSEILAEVQRARFPDGRVSLFSAHQMGTCRMGVKPESSVLKPSCETWEINGLYVVDGSTFPTASGVNPMVTICSIGHFAAQGLKNRMAKNGTAKASAKE